jgi:hypothetical protein
MNHKIILLISLHIFSANIIGAQNLEESLGGTKTNFQIYSDTVNLKVSDQIIIKRAEKQTYSDSNFGTGWGYGYQSFHLEFITNKNIKIENYKYKAGRDNETKLELIFYDSNNRILATSSLPYYYVDLYNNPSITDSVFFYSIDLIDIPIVLLDKTAKIGMIKKVAEK